MSDTHRLESTGRRDSHSNQSAYSNNDGLANLKILERTGVPAAERIITQKMRGGNRQHHEVIQHHSEIVDPGRQFLARIYRGAAMVHEDSDSPHWWRRNHLLSLEKV